MAPVKIQIKFANFLIGVNKAAVNAAVLAELGMYAVSIQPLKLSISFWLHVLNSGENSLVSAAYKASLLLPNEIAKKIELFLSTFDFSHIWEEQNTFSKRRLLHAIDKKT